ncbi:MAG: FAD-binding oxidoreductase [Acidimicrobiales bacterium]
MKRPPRVALDELVAVLGSDRVRVDGDEGVTVVPTDVSMVSTVVRWAATHRVAVVPLGGDTGRSGGTRRPPDRPSILLSTARLDRIESVDAGRSTITAGAGVTIEELQDAAAAVGLKFAPDWGARGTATLGGAIATNAGGNNVIRYGTMRRHVLGVEAVLADGRIWDGRRALRKDASGYDLTQLMIGAEGTLGIVTSATVHLVPATPHEQSAFAPLSGLDSLTDLLAMAQRVAGDSLTAFELLSEIGLRRLCTREGLPRPTEVVGDHYLLVKLASVDPVTDRLVEILDRGVAHGHLLDGVVAATPDQESALWALRDGQSAVLAFPELEPSAVKFDVAVPLDHIAAFLTRAEEAATAVAPSATVYGFGHVGDGNIHLMVLPPPDGIDEFAAGRAAVTDAIDHIVLDLHGTLSAEHGIGSLLPDRIGPQKPPIEWEMMRAIKTALDPLDLLNPGKPLPPPPRTAGELTRKTGVNSP